MKVLALLLLICYLGSAWAAPPSPCPGPPDWLKHRLKKETPWLVSAKLRRQVAEKSPEFGSLLEFQQQCHWSEMASLGAPSMEGRYVVAILYTEVPLRSISGLYHGLWTIAVVPENKGDKMPEGNLLEIGRKKWTLLSRDQDGSRAVLASGRY